MKFLNLQTLIQGYWCARGGGGELIRSKGHGGGDVAVKVIKPDGVVDIYRRPIKACEVMVQFPEHLICHSHSFYIGQKIRALSPQEQLHLGHNYFLLPIHCFESVLSFVTIASSFASFRSSLASTSRTKPVITCKAFDIQKAASGYLQVRVSDEFVSSLTEQEQSYSSLTTEKGNLCTTSQLKKDYTQLVSYTQWKPKLETIKESKRKKLSSSSFGIKSIDKGGQQQQQQQKIHKSKHQHHRHKSSKIKIKANKCNSSPNT